MTPEVAETGKATSPLRIALIHTTASSERGVDRFVLGLGSALAARGHGVTVMPSSQTTWAQPRNDNLRVVRARRLPEPWFMRWYEPGLINAPSVMWRLVREEFDIVHAFSLSDAWAAVQACKRLGGPPVAFFLPRAVTRSYLVAFRYRLEMMRAVVTDAGTCGVPTQCAAERFQSYLLVNPDILPAAIDADSLPVDMARAVTPTLVVVGMPTPTLISAFRDLRTQRPDVLMLIVRDGGSINNRDVPLPQGATVIETADAASRAELLAQAWASVVPSVDGSLDLSVLESLAAGTPVAIARSNVMSSPTADRATVRTYESHDRSETTQAMQDVLQLGSNPEVRKLCRARVEELDWRRIIGIYERVYAATVDRHPLHCA